jgi:transcriptional regulator with XRE-family HTH domain
MQHRRNQSLEVQRIAERLATARLQRGLTQRELAARCRLQRQQLTYFERGSRVPSLDQLLRLAQALDLPLQRFLSGADRPGSAWRNLTLELRNLGLIDLWVETPVVPGAFRRPEESIALALGGDEPEARILEGLPALLAWNRWHHGLLRAFARTQRPGTLYRLAWLAEIVLALDRRGGFPGGCPRKQDLAAVVKRTKKPPSEPVG